MTSESLRIKSTLANDARQDNQTADILLVSRFQSLIEALTTNEEASPGIRQASFYAGKLNVHPNHLNAVVKRITGKTTSSIIQNQLMASAKSLLIQTNLSIKEIAFKLHFVEPTHFNSFFKKNTGITPQQYRYNQHL
ncbi:AraC family transcriptional regulator [Chitinophaga sp. HK235]|uniref:helix-turn-helix domain-containing protein n=1 Tax=Chitinophaga sp. HK235 TaxID=2952571 RepID=UPI001BAE4027|nr:helix-turn-helix transcriptional regulator [Chitinophaga sp. HK235]